MLWVNFIIGLIFIFLCFVLNIIHYHTQEQTKIKIELRIKLNYNMYTYPCQCPSRQQFYSDLGYWTCLLLLNYICYFHLNRCWKNYSGYFSWASTIGRTWTDCFNKWRWNPETNGRIFFKSWFIKKKQHCCYILQNSFCYTEQETIQRPPSHGRGVMSVWYSTGANNQH